jgi:hypothetical protein
MEERKRGRKEGDKRKGKLKKNEQETVRLCVAGVSDDMRSAVPVWAYL